MINPDNFQDNEKDLTPDIWLWITITVAMVMKKIKPVTPQEWWESAPWQPIETAPVVEKEYLLLFGDGTVLVQDCKFSFFKKVNGNMQEFRPIKWISLPLWRLND